LSIVKPEVRLLGLANNRALLSARDEFEIRFGLPGSSAVVIPTVDQIVGLSIVEAQPNNVVPGIYESATSTQLISSATITVQNPFGLYRFVGQPAVAGTYKVRATYRGDNYDSAVQTVQGLGLRFSQQTYILGKGMRATGLKIERTNGGQPYAPPTQLLVGINNVDSTRFSTPAQVVIPFNQSSVFVPLTGLQVTQQSVNLSAFDSNGTGYSPAPAIAVSVVEPDLEFRFLAGATTVNGGRNGFVMRLRVPGATDAMYRASGTKVLQLSIANAVPANIVDGIYQECCSGSTIQTVEINDGQVESAYRYVGSAFSIGSYQVQAAIAGNSNSPWTSTAQTVAAQTSRLTLSGPDRLTKDFYGDFSVSLSYVPAETVQVQLQSDPVGAFEFQPVTLTLGPNSTSASVRAIARTVGPAMIRAVGSGAFGTPTRAVEVLPFTSSVIYSNSDNRVQSMSFEGYAPVPIPVSIALENVSPAGNVTLQNCPTTVAIGQDSVSCSLSFNDQVHSTFAIKFDFGNGLVFRKGNLTTRLIIAGPQTLYANTSNPFYVQQCSQAQYAGGPASVLTVRPDPNAQQCAFYVDALTPGIGQASATDATGSSSIDIEVLPFQLEFKIFLATWFRLEFSGGTLINDVPVTLQIVDDVPSGLVQFIGGPTPQTYQTTIRSNLAGTEEIFMSSSAIGSFRIKADAGSYGIFYSDVLRIDSLDPPKARSSARSEESSHD
jgi:hypothetical protein